MLREGESLAQASESGPQAQIASPPGVCTLVKFSAVAREPQEEPASLGCVPALSQRPACVRDVGTDENALGKAVRVLTAVSDCRGNRLFSICGRIVHSTRHFVFISWADIAGSRVKPKQFRKTSVCVYVCNDDDDDYSTQDAGTDSTTGSFSFEVDVGRAASLSAGTAGAWSAAADQNTRRWRAAPAVGGRARGIGQ